MISQKARDEWSDDRWQHPCRRQQREGPRTQFIWVSPTKNHVDTNDGQPPPKPWITRAKTNMGIVTDDPAITAPSPNKIAPVISGSRGPARSFHSPAITMATKLDTRYPLNAHAYELNPSSARATEGIAVATPIPSNANIVMTATMPRVKAR